MKRRKLTALVLGGALAVSLTACSSQLPESPPEQDPNATSSETDVVNLEIKNFEQYSTTDKVMIEIDGEFQEVAVTYDGDTTVSTKDELPLQESYEVKSHADEKWVTFEGSTAEDIVVLEPTLELEELAKESLSEYASSGTYTKDDSGMFVDEALDYNNWINVNGTGGTITDKITSITIDIIDSSSIDALEKVDIAAVDEEDFRSDGMTLIEVGDFTTDSFQIQAQGTGVGESNTWTNKDTNLTVSLEEIEGVDLEATPEDRVPTFKWTTYLTSASE